MKIRNTFYAVFFFFTVTIINTFGQGAAVAPSRLFFSASPGSSETQVLRVTNSTSSKQAYTISFADFEPEGNKGKTRMMQHGESVHSLKSNITATPNFFELDPGQTQEINVAVSLANVPEANQVKWGSVVVRLAREREPGEGGNQMGFGIMETFQLVVYIFQTPPAVNLKRAEITGFTKNINDKGENGLLLTVDNTGEAILNCASYVELTSYSTGKVERIGVKAYTMLPDSEREVFFALPDTLKSGTYSALGVVDFGSREEIEAAEFELKVE
jgi:P pilus assembly chaperone PapD